MIGPSGISSGPAGNTGLLAVGSVPSNVQRCVTPASGFPTVTVVPGAVPGRQAERGRAGHHRVGLRGDRARRVVRMERFGPHRAGHGHGKGPRIERRRCGRRGAVQRVANTGERLRLERDQRFAGEGAGAWASSWASSTCRSSSYRAPSAAPSPTSSS